ncbi:MULTISPECIES: DUF7882 family protein [Clavibacter]|uniref:ATP-dependent DNA ligase n=3 Tax=Clavibacter TaxID=1573 RepID=A0A399NFU7_9MICO|nr:MULTISPECIES: hypothetical protein [Clavibacter]KDP91171.1 ATP-dependent DNA ligase [Clavibacter cf. michiganensis LMG 26808]RII92942.1 ATP-dependent DNA ligase [Clavibacter michiganensis]UKF25627.1 ATP-dependent DNA ligase [Clavibacter sp. A6099]
MGQLIFDSTTRTTIDDRALAHLQIVMLNKLRRRESFAFSWKYPASEGDGRSTVWVAPELPLHFRFSGSRVPAINPAWVDLLMDSANTGSGLHLVPEPPYGSAARAEPPAD